MKKGILWMLLSFLLVAALVLASCGEAEPGEQEEEEEEEPVGEQEEEEEEPVGEQEEEEEEPVAGAPQYGGTITTFCEWNQSEPVSFDSIASPRWWNTSVFVRPYLEPLFVADFANRGPRGTNEFHFQAKFGVPAEYLTGALADTWEITTEPLGVTVYLKQGVMWAGREGVMEARELTADDVAQHLNRMRVHPTWVGGVAYIESITATDRYTVRFDFNMFDAGWPNGIGLLAGREIMPPEVVEAGGDDWRNAVGTGPFIITNYVVGSYELYERNPNWYETATIDGEEYQLPFIDKLYFTILTDESTRIAALRTGALDMWQTISLMYQETLTKNEPDLIQSTWLAAAGTNLNMLGREETDIFYDVDVRRAVAVATDLGAIRDAIFPGGNKYGYRITPGLPEYTAPEDLPPETRLLYDYNPALAIEMLADAGYPDGFSVDFIVGAGQAQLLDIATMVKEQWAKVGVTVNVLPLDPVDFAYRKNNFLYDIWNDTHETNDPLLSMGARGRRPAGASSNLVDPVFQDMFMDAAGTIDDAERTAKLKACAVYHLHNVLMFDLCDGYNISAWWPWVKNYYGEVEAGFFTTAPFIAHVWIDQDLKAEMGY